jgi:hypothetical protein
MRQQMRGLDGQSIHFEVEKLPDECPICHAHVSPISQSGVQTSNSTAQIPFLCTSDACRSMFIGYYYDGPNYKFARVAPVVSRAAGFSAEIAETSATFVSVYNQASSSGSGRFEPAHWNRDPEAVRISD